MFELIAHISVVPDTGNDCYPIRPKPTAEKDLERKKSLILDLNQTPH